MFKLSYQPLSPIWFLVATDKAVQKAISEWFLNLSIHINHPEDLLKHRLQGHLQTAIHYIWSKYKNLDF